MSGTFLSTERQRQANSQKKVPDTFFAMFQQELLANMYDGVVFLDARRQVIYWNRGAEQLTGIAADSVLERPFTPSLFEMRDANGVFLDDHNCPIAASLRSGVQSLERLRIRGRNGKDVTIDAHAIPVLSFDGTVRGASLLLHDASGQASLEERCHSLYKQALRDPLTQLANRAEFDRVHLLFVNVHLERRLPCSLIICDIDRFKQVNDTYGHQAGDEVIKCFSQLLKSTCRSGDLVARYGGEEFVMLCADCDNTTATARAEQLRRAFSEQPQPKLGGKPCTASFGVTEIQAGDDAQTMLNRADRALLMAKDDGRNIVVRLGAGLVVEPAKRGHRGFWFWRKPPEGALIDRYFVTNVPMKMAVEKLRGFISDHQAEIVVIDGGRLEIVVHPGRIGLGRRQSDRPVPLVVDVKLAEDRAAVTNLAGEEKVTVAFTRVHLQIRPRKDRDRRRANVTEQARRIVASLRSYLMADDEQPDAEPGVFKRAKSLLTPWQGRK